MVSELEKAKSNFLKKVERKYNRMIVEGLNFVKKHVRADAGQRGGVFLKEAPIHYSRLNLVDPITNKPTRISRRYLEDGKLK